MRLGEIQRTPTEKPETGAEQNAEKGIPKGVKSVPGAPNLGYLLVGGRGQMMSMFTGASYVLSLYDLKRSAPIGWLALRDTIFPLPNSKQVANAIIYPEYRGQGLGQSLYGVATKVLGMTIVADDTQTPEARRLWANLYNIPGVSVRGWINFSDSDVNPANDIFGNAQHNLRKIARLQGLPKGQTPRPLAGSKGRSDFVYFDFPVTSGLDGRELQAAEKLAAIYTSYHPEDNRRDYDVGLYARWTGQ